MDKPGTTSADPLSRLHALRRTVRRRLLAYGVGVVGTGVTVVFLLLVTLDWLLRLPAGLRLLGGVAFGAGVCLATWRWIVQPWRGALNISVLAARLEQHFETLHDRLRSAVDFLAGSPAGSRQMMQHEIARTGERIRQVSLDAALTLRPLVVRWAAFVIALGVLGGIWGFAPNWLRTGYYRYLYPMGQIDWPCAVGLTPLNTDELVALGESLTVGVEVTRGLHETLRPVVHLREVEGERVALAMRREGENTFYVTLDGVTTDLEYWFEAGDADTRDQSGTVHVVRRPEVVEALATVTGPPYATAFAPRVYELREGVVQAPAGGVVTLNIRASKALAPEPAAAGLRLETQEFVPLRVDADDPRQLTGELQIQASVAFRIELRDTIGFTGGAGPQYYIQAQPDRPPTVTITEPRSTVEVTPRGALWLDLRVEDDFGVTALELAGELTERDTVFQLPLTEQARTTTVERGVRAELRHYWEMESIDPQGLEPGEVVVFHANAWDNRAGAEIGPQLGSSASLRLKIISDVELDVRLRDDLTLIETRIRAGLMDQLELAESVAALIPAADSASGLTEVERERAGVLAQQQGRLARRLEGLATRVKGVQQRMQLNHAGTDEDRTQLARVASALSELAQGLLADARRQLVTARETAALELQRGALQATHERQQEAARRLRELIHALSQWGDFQAVFTRTRDLRDRQDELSTRTTELSRTTLGKSLEALTEAEAERLARLRRDQEQLATDFAQMLTRMEQLADSSEAVEPTEVQALTGALRAARAHDSERHLDAATQALAQNRTAAAALQQKQVTEALRAMIEALEERSERQLARLRKRLDDALQKVEQTIEEQQALRAATKEAVTLSPGVEGLAELGQQQHALARNTKLLARELAEVDQVMTAARLVHGAAGPMTRATDELTAQQPETAQEAQDEALAFLEEARADLEDLARQLAEQALKQSLNRVRGQLERILAAQETVNAGIVELREELVATGGLRRTQARTASRLARQQTEALDLVAELRLKLQEVVVYDWALGRVAAWMESCRVHLEERRLDDELALLAPRITRELRTLILAIEQTQSLPTLAEFAEAEAGQGGPGGAGRGQQVGGKPVPTIAELLVLKAMQQVINERTRALADSYDPHATTEGELAELRMLGEDQQQVQELTERVTQRARRP